MKTGRSEIFSIMIVEDDLTLLRLIKHKLSSDDLHIDTATSGNEALEKIQGKKPDLILLDYLLNDMDGADVIDFLIQQDIHIPFIIMTGYGDEKVAVHMMKLGAQDYIVKDTNFMSLLPVVVEQVKEQLTIKEKLIEAEEALKESKYNYQALVENSRDIIFITDTQGRFVFINRTFETKCGYKLNNFIDRQFTEVIDYDDIVKANEKFLNILDGEDVQPFGVNIITDNGRKIPFELNITVLQDSPSKKKGVLVIARDITARRKAEEALRENEEFFRTLIESSSDGILILNGDGTFKYLSASCETIFGYKTDELIGKRIFDIVIQEDMVEAINFFWEVVENHTEGNSFEISIIRKDGTIKVIEGLGQNLIRNPIVNGIFLSIRDLADRKRLEDQLVSAQKMEAVGRLAGGIAHDFNNIMTAIINYSEVILEQKLENEQVVAWIGQIIDSAKKAAHLTTQLLAFSSRQMFMPKFLKVNDIIKDMTQKFKNLISMNIRLRINLQDDLKLIKSDRSQVEQVLTNLVQNAREAVMARYRESGDQLGNDSREIVGNIELTTEIISLADEDIKNMPDAYSGAFICITVADDGIGIKPEARKHIFEPFYTTKEGPKGSGLGLAVVYGIIKQHKGWVNVKSDFGSGTQFRLYLPVAEHARESARDEVKSGKALKGNGERILLVEDEDNVRQITAETLRNQGYVVFEAINHENALEIFNKENAEFDIIFSDVVLPDKSGIELVETLKTKEKTGIILTSGYFDDDAHMAKLIDKNFRFLPKPYELDVLLNTIKSVLPKG